MAMHNITDSALLVKKSRRTIQRYIADGKLTMVRDALGKPQIDSDELIRVFGALSKVSQKKLIKKSQNVTRKQSRKKNSINLTHDELEDIITRAVEKALSKAIPILIEHKKVVQISKPISNLISKPVLESTSEPTPELMSKSVPDATRLMVPVDNKKTKSKRSINRPTTKNKESKNGYAAAFGLPNAITEVIHLQIMKLHGEGLTLREIGKQVSVSQASIQRTINAST